VASDQSAFEATREIRNERAGETEDMHVSLNDEDEARRMRHGNGKLSTLPMHPGRRAV
jgi:hypothetical protein